MVITCSRYSRLPQSNWTGWNIQPQIYITHERQLRISTSSHQHTGQNNTGRHLMSSMPSNLSVCNDLEHYGNNGKGVYFWPDDDNNMSNISSQPYKSEWASCKPATPYLWKDDSEKVPHVRHTLDRIPPTFIYALLWILLPYVFNASGWNWFNDGYESEYKATKQQTLCILFSAIIINCALIRRNEVQLTRNLSE